MSDKAARHNKGKPQLSMVLEARNAINELAAVLGFGAEKYERGNWRKGMSWVQTADSMLRHTTAFLAGEDNDPESGLPHVGHILCNALFLAEFYTTHPEHDDRSKVVEYTGDDEWIKETEPTPPLNEWIKHDGGEPLVPIGTTVEFETWPHTVARGVIVELPGRNEAYPNHYGIRTSDPAAGSYLRKREDFEIQ